MPGIDKYEFEKAAETVFDRLNYFNDYVLQTIGRRIKNVGQLSAYDQQTLKNMADISGDMKAITKKLAEITGQNIKDIEKIYTQTITDGVNSYKPLYDLKNMDFVPFEENEFAQQLAKHWFKETAGKMVNLSRTKAIGFDKCNLKGEVIGHTPLEGAFQKAIDDAVVAVSTGTVDFNSAMRETIKNLGGSGVKVTYGSGVNRSLSAMVRQNLLYGVKQSSAAYDEQISRELGCDGFEVDAHAGCRPSHEFMQGQMYSYDGDKRIDGVLYKDGSEALARLNDYGCLHFKTGVILGVSEPRYSKEELDRIHEETTRLIEYDGRQKTLYEWKQTQRNFEREIRKESQIRDMAKAADNKTLAKDCEYKINAYRKKYDDMCEKVGLEHKYENMRTYVGSSVKSVDNSAKSGIIKEQGRKNITVITDKAIEKVPKVEISGYSDEQNAFIQQQHKELLRYARDNNDSKEVAFVFEKGLTNRTEYVGNDKSLDFGMSLSGKGSDLFIMHNHPRNSSFSYDDVIEFIRNDNIEVLTIVKNTGGIEILNKSDSFDKKQVTISLNRNIKKIVKTNTDAEYNMVIEKWLNGNNGGAIEWTKKE